ncbi:MAG: phosphoribosylformylglycinamidine synthase I [Candidatus Omnitrophica bacterium]|nr:phosphoribosylformylglycinamidine synthase I [Candidatus Omnitrophota bacterium]
MKQKGKVKVLILRTAGTNCDWETEHGFALAGAAPERVHISRLLDGSVSLSDYGIMVIPGGFSYGDDLSAGKVLANELRFKLRDQIFSFAESGRPIIGICNGFQVLVKTGLLPFTQRENSVCATLTFNDSGCFEDRWIYLRCTGKTPLLSGLSGEIIALPIAHGAGKFLTGKKSDLALLKKSGQIAFQYVGAEGKTARNYPENPNGSPEAVAAVTNEKGNILGMMPHPERFLYHYCHPSWTRQEGKSTDGLRLLKSIVSYAK